MDRNNKATLPLTALCTVFKSSAKDLDLPKLEIIIQSDYFKEIRVNFPKDQPYTTIHEQPAETDYPIIMCRLRQRKDKK